MSEYLLWVDFAAAGIPFVLIFVLAYLGFLTHLPTKTRRLFFFAGTLYITGALGVELISGYYADSYGMQNLTYATLTAIEESLEMFGVIVFIYTLLLFISSHVQEVRVWTNKKPVTAKPRLQQLSELSHKNQNSLDESNHTRG